MKMNKTLLAAAMVFGVAMTAHAADQGHGKVTFTGSIIDAPCTISPDSIDQTVDLGQVAKSSLLNGGKGTPQNFQIALENCSFGTPATKNKVAVTFTGMNNPVNPALLGITGTATGAGIALTDGAGTMIDLATPTQPQTLQDGNNTLSFAAYLQGESASAAITEGDFTAVTNFTLAYN